MLAKFALGLMTLAVVGITVHIFSHAFPNSPEDITKCEFCKAIASTSAPGPALDLPKPVVFSLEQPAIVRKLVPAIFIASTLSRAPPVI